MSRCISRSLELLAACATLACVLAPHALHAQACCAGASALTPGRLTMHEQALVGALARAAFVPGSFDADGSYVSAPAGSSDVELEQDSFGAVRLLRRGQVALLVPFVEARR